MKKVALSLHYMYAWQDIKFNEYENMWLFDLRSHNYLNKVIGLSKWKFENKLL